jgi:hypothetical protein
MRSGVRRPVDDLMWAIGDRLDSNGQTFFAAFFQKRSASFLTSQPTAFKDTHRSSPPADRAGRRRRTTFAKFARFHGHHEAQRAQPDQGHGDRRDQGTDHRACADRCRAWITASITNEAIDELALAVGDEAIAVIKASDVMVGK